MQRLCHYPFYIRNEQTLLEEAKASEEVDEDTWMSLNWLNYEKAFVNWLMRETGRQVADDKGTMTITKSMLIEK